MNLKYAECSQIIRIIIYGYSNIFEAISDFQISGRHFKDIIYRVFLLRYPFHIFPHFIQFFDSMRRINALKFLDFGNQGDKKIGVFENSSRDLHDASILRYPIAFLFLIFEI